MPASPHSAPERGLVGRLFGRDKARSSPMLLVDKSKYNQPMLEVVCALGELDELVVDSLSAKTLAAEHRKAGVRLHVS